MRTDGAASMAEDLQSHLTNSGRLARETDVEVRALELGMRQYAFP